ncbi:MAG: ORF6N domain-containing protein [Thermoanaerobaculia bacterium]
MKRPKPIESLIFTIRGRKVLVDADLASIYQVETRTLNQAVKRNIERFPEDFIFQLNAKEKSEVITNCDHLAQLKFAKSLPFAFTEHGAIMAATILNSKQAVAMSVYVVRAFIQMREQLAANQQILKRLAEIDRTLLQHDAGLRDIYRKLLPLLQPSPLPPTRRIGFGRDDKTGSTKD